MVFDGALIHAERSRERDHVAMVIVTEKVNQDAFMVGKLSHFLFGLAGNGPLFNGLALPESPAGSSHVRARLRLGDRGLVCHVSENHPEVL
jgi:hypothetical protein